MSSAADASARGVANGPCRECLRRGWLLSTLGRRLDYQSRDETRLLDLLELGDEQLIAAIGGRRKRELTDRWRRFDTQPEHDTSDPSVQAICRHVAGYPSGLCEHQQAPAALYVRGGGTERLARLMAKPAVAIVGSVHPTDYGMEMARSLARGLAGSGVTIVSGFANGIAAAAYDGALRAGGETVTVMSGGVDVIAPAGRRGLYERVLEQGCAVSERPCGLTGRRWTEPARARTIAAMAQLTIVVEAGSSQAELRPARVACLLGRSVVAVPGRVTSPASVGTNLLLMAGAPLVRGPADALEELYRSTSPIAAIETSERDWAGTGTGSNARADARGLNWPEVQALLARESGSSPTSGLEARLRSVYEQVGAGCDTPGKLAGAGQDPADAMLALSELELAGLLGRGDGGRYVPRESLAG